MTNLLMGDEDFKAADNLSQWDGSVILPLLHCFDIIHHDHKIVLFALIVNFRLASISTRHYDEFREQ